MEEREGTGGDRFSKGDQEGTWGQGGPTSGYICVLFWKESPTEGFSGEGTCGRLRPTGQWEQGWREKAAPAGLRVRTDSGGGGPRGREKRQDETLGGL